MGLAGRAGDKRDLLIRYISGSTRHSPIGSASSESGCAPGRVESNGTYATPASELPSLCDCSHALRACAGFQGVSAGA